VCPAVGVEQLFRGVVDPVERCHEGPCEQLPNRSIGVVERRRLRRTGDENPVIAERKVEMAPRVAVPVDASRDTVRYRERRGISDQRDALLGLGGGCQFRPIPRSVMECVRL